MINLHDIPKEKIESPYQWLRDWNVNFNVNFNVDLTEWNGAWERINNHMYTATTTTNTTNTFYMNYMDLVNGGV